MTAVPQPAPRPLVRPPTPSVPAPPVELPAPEPDEERPAATGRAQYGPRNPAWRGDNATYTALHSRAYRALVKTGVCSTCGRECRTEWANLTGDYADLDDYREMCRSCHRVYDNARRRASGVSTSHHVPRRALQAVTRSGRIPSYQGGKPIPVGRWTARELDPILCQRGWHACRWEDVASHIAAELWVCELDGVIVEGDDKVAAERLRLVRQVPITDSQFRHFAADCAEAVLHLFERERPDDDRPRKAIEAARLFADDGKITPAGLDAVRAARDAVRAAWDAVRAAWDAAGAARVVWNAADAAWDAARAAQSTLLLARLGLDPADFAHRELT